MRIDSSIKRILLGALPLLLVAGCTDMKDQPRYEPLEENTFFANGAASRPLIEGTVARGYLREDDALYRGLDAQGAFVTDLPVELNATLLARGKDRYEIFCTPCHDRTGDGYGMVVRRGYKQPTSFHDARVKGMSAGYFYDVITNGFGEMSSYAAQIKPEDRWAIVAYLRALQYAHDVDANSLPTDIRHDLDAHDIVDTRATEDEANAGHH